MKISILTCVLNNDRFIDEAIKSFQKQSYENKEHVIIDGGSTDKTVSIIKKLKNKPHLHDKIEFEIAFLQSAIFHQHTFPCHHHAQT